MKINQKFKNLIPSLSEDEREQLEENILADGIRDPLVLWGDVLVDGHNRYEIAQKHNIEFRTVQREFSDESAAELWILQNQLGRRNLSDFQRVELVRKCEGAVKEKAERNLHLSSGRGIKGVENLPQVKSRDELGAMAGVSGKTYEHAAAVIDKAPEPVVKAARAGDLSINAAHEVTRMGFEQQREIADRIEQGEAPREVVDEVKKRPHVANNSGNNEWYTPAEYIEAARRVMGSIDFDPASSEIANQTVQAAEYYTAETNGLAKEWHGNVWMNPPYSSDLIEKFVDKLIEQHGNINQAIVLVNNATETGWFSKLVRTSSAVCFPKSRVKFYMPDGRTGAPLQGQAVLYIGSNARKFLDEFRAFGWGCVPEWNM